MESAFEARDSALRLSWTGRVNPGENRVRSNRFSGFCQQLDTYAIINHGIPCHSATAQIANDFTNESGIAARYVSALWRFEFGYNRRSVTQREFAVELGQNGALRHDHFIP